MKIADGLHRVGNGMVNAYLIEEAGQVTVVDAALPGYWKLLPEELAAMGRTLGDVRAVVLTHGHSDHLGFAEKARRELDIPVAVHELDELLARGKVKNPAKGTGPFRPLPLLRFIAVSMRWGGWQIDRLTTVSTFGDGATLDVPGAPRVILAPGHTPGSAALHVPSLHALLVGDVFSTLAVTTGAVGPRIAPFTADETEALASLDRLAGIDAEWVLPGHGEPWTQGIDTAIRATRASAGQGRRS